MAGSTFLRIGTVPKSLFLSACKHNKRELPESGNIDPTRSHLNYCPMGAGTAQGVADEARRLKRLSGITRTRKNCAEALEIVFSLPHNFTGDHEAFFRDSLDWAEQEYCLPVLSFDVHLDEACKHAHCLLLPVRDGKMQGNAIAGDTKVIRARQASFFAKVGAKHGLSMRKKLSVSEKRSMERQVLARLASDSMMKSEIYPTVRDDIRANPEKFAEQLGITTPPQPSP